MSHQISSPLKTSHNDLIPKCEYMEIVVLSPSFFFLTSVPNFQFCFRNNNNKKQTEEEEGEEEGAEGEEGEAEGEVGEDV